MLLVAGLQDVGGHVDQKLPAGFDREDSSLLGDEQQTVEEVLVEV